MNTRNDWLSKEIMNLKREQKRGTKKYDTLMLIKLAILLVPLGLFAMSFECPACHTVITVEKSEGVSWRCGKCGNFNWSNAPDWQGNYYCGKCGTKSGDD